MEVIKSDTNVHQMCVSLLNWNIIFKQREQKLLFTKTIDGNYKLLINLEIFHDYFVGNWERTLYIKCK